jgi:hypothetical protein
LNPPYEVVSKISAGSGLGLEAGGDSASVKGISDCELAELCRADRRRGGTSSGEALVLLTFELAGIDEIEASVLRFSWASVATSSTVASATCSEPSLLMTIVRHEGRVGRLEGITFSAEAEGDVRAD